MSLVLIKDSSLPCSFAYQETRNVAMQRHFFWWGSKQSFDFLAACRPTRRPSAQQFPPQYSIATAHKPARLLKQL